MEPYIYLLLNDIYSNFDNVGVVEKVLLDRYVDGISFELANFLAAKEELIKLGYIKVEKEESIVYVFLTPLGESKFKEILDTQLNTPEEEINISFEDEQKLKDYIQNIGTNEDWKLIQKIDLILYYFSLRSNREMYKKYVEIVTDIEMAVYACNYEKETISLSDFSKIVSKLYKEQHITLMFKDVEDVIFFNNKFQITFDGLLWLERGGYRGEIERNTQAERRIREYQNLTKILAVGVSTPFLWYFQDLIKTYLHQWLDLYKICALSMACACLGASLWYILPLIGKIKKQ